MPKRSWISISAIVALGALSLFLAYSVIDAAISLTYARDDATELKSERDIVREVAINLAKGQKREALTNFLSTKYGSSFFIKEEIKDTIFVSGVGFRFRGDDLVEVLFHDDSASTYAGLTGKD